MTEREQVKTQIWVLEPTWQNFSSMYREAICAQEASTGMEISHHRMAALYFGISTIECLLNTEMTRHQVRHGMDHDGIHEILRKSEFKKKLKTWPQLITGNELSLRPSTLNSILAINDLRGNLTHLKNYWPDTFDDLGRTDPMQVVDLVAEYIIALYQAKGELFPYWVWGWNYLCPNRDGHHIALLPHTQLFHSLSSLGYKFQRQASDGGREREQETLTNFDGYQKVAAFLRSCDRCEPKWEVAPHQPKLCRRWWDPVHQSSCGAATPQAIARAIELDEERGRSMKQNGYSRAKPKSEARTWPQVVRMHVKRWLRK